MLNEQQFGDKGIETVRPGMVTINGRPTPAAAHVRYGDSPSTYAIVPHENGGLSYVAHVPGWEEGKRFEVGPLHVHPPRTEGGDWTTSVNMGTRGTGDPHEVLQQSSAGTAVAPDEVRRNAEFMRHAVHERPEKWWRA